MWVCVLRTSFAGTVRPPTIPPFSCHCWPEHLCVAALEVAGVPLGASRGSCFVLIVAHPISPLGRCFGSPLTCSQAYFPCWRRPRGWLTRMSALRGCSSRGRVLHVLSCCTMHVRTCPGAAAIGCGEWIQCVSINPWGWHMVPPAFSKKAGATPWLHYANRSGLIC